MFGLASSLSAKLAAAAVALGFAFTGGAILMHKIDNARYEALQLQYARAQQQAIAAAQAEQKRLDDIALAAAQSEAATQAAMTARAKRQLLEIRRHVTDRPCVSFGLVRVLDAAVHGVLADTLALPAGKSDDTCAPVDAATLARSISDNYAAARANAEQLNALIAVLRAMSRAHR